jgi:hypothetical protein
MIDISKAFGTPAEPIADFFQRPGVGYYIPLYQREYSWDQENIDQLMEDICNGVDALVDNDDTIRFMGTVILLKESNPTVNIEPKDMRALPTSINNVIDGQQRISTIALLACLLYQKIYQKRERLPVDSIYDGLREEINSKLDTLEELFSVDLKRGKPKRKPIIVRGSVDGWTFDGSDDINYKSDISLYLAKFIRSIQEKADFPTIPTNSLVGTNLKRMIRWLTLVENAHERTEEGFPPAWKIISNISEEYIWSYNREELRNIIKTTSEPMSKDEMRVCSLVQLFAFTHYLLHRCCFIQIEPILENWAFDMFQSLNASGTPLTAVETFKPLVVNVINKSGSNYKGSKCEEYFGRVDSFLSNTRNASTKNKLTNEYLTTFALTFDGSKLSSQFSSQRRWLTDAFCNKTGLTLKEEFIRRLADLATYWVEVIFLDPNTNTTIAGTASESEDLKKTATLCALYLRDSGHKMANTLLSRFYSNILRKKEGSGKEFLRACKALAAFFTLWRSAYGNTGLDEVYRKILKGDPDSGIPQMSWEGEDSNLSFINLSHYLNKVLEEKKIYHKEEWKNKANQNLRYDNAAYVCKFALFITAHDTILDPENHGLMKCGAPGITPYLDPLKWISKDFKSIEHIAPQRPPKGSGWDENLYKTDYVESIGNLTLLPVPINSSAGNKRWLDKLTYYKHLAESDPDNLSALKKHAAENGVELAEETIELLMSTSHKHHIKPLVELGYEGNWDKFFVEKRTERICNILWDRIRPWLQP